MGYFAASLNRRRRLLGDQEESLAARRVEWRQEQREATARQDRQIAEMAREETLLREQRSAVVRLMGEMRQLRRAPDSEALRRENEELRRTLAERDSALAAAREEIGRRTAEAEEDRLGTAALRQFPFELEEDRRGLADQILDIQGRYADLERAAREAELQIANDRERIAQGRERLELVRQALQQPAGRSSSQDTVVDMPSPLHCYAEPGPSPEPCDATAEAPRQPSRSSVAGG